MNFALSTKYSEIDLEEVGPEDLLLIGGGCGESGGGAVSVSSVQAAQQSAASAPGANSSAFAIVSNQSGNVTIDVGYCYTLSQGSVNGSARIEACSGHVTTLSGGGGFWSSVSGFFSWLFGSH